MTPDTLTQRRVLGDKLGGNEPQFRIYSGSVFSFPSAAFFPQWDPLCVATLARNARQIGRIGEIDPWVAPSAAPCRYRKPLRSWTNDRRPAAAMVRVMRVGAILPGAGAARWSHHPRSIAEASRDGTAATVSNDASAAAVSDETSHEFESTTRPTTWPARRASIHFWASAIGSSRIGGGLILPARASAISSWPSASVPTMNPSMVMRL